MCRECGGEFMAYVSQRRIFCSYKCKYVGCKPVPHLRGKYDDPHAFWSQVTKTDGCWEFQGYRNAAGYGHIGVNNALVLTHRFAWMLEHGSIPEGLFVLHHCDNPPCVRINHLYLGTRADNGYDMSARNRHADVAGDKHPQAKLSSADIPVIRDRRERGEELASIADDYGVTPQTIYQIHYRRRWRHIEETHARSEAETSAVA